MYSVCGRVCCVCVCLCWWPAIISYLNCNLNVKLATRINLNICLPLKMRLASNGRKMICLLQLPLLLLLLLQLLQLLQLLLLLLLLLSLCSQSSHCGLIIINIPPVQARGRETKRETIKNVSQGNVLFSSFSIFNHSLHAIYSCTWAINKYAMSACVCANHRQMFINYSVLMHAKWFYYDLKMIFLPAQFDNSKSRK